MCRLPLRNRLWTVKVRVMTPLSLRILASLYIWCRPYTHHRLSWSPTGDGSSFWGWQSILQTLDLIRRGRVVRCIRNSGTLWTNTGGSGFIRPCRVGWLSIGRLLKARRYFSNRGRPRGCACQYELLIRLRHSDYDWSHLLEVPWVVLAACVGVLVLGGPNLWSRSSSDDPITIWREGSI